MHEQFQYLVFLLDIPSLVLFASKIQVEEKYFAVVLLFVYLLSSLILCCKEQVQEKLCRSETVFYLSYCFKIVSLQCSDFQYSSVQLNMVFILQSHKTFGLKQTDTCLYYFVILIQMITIVPQVQIQPLNIIQILEIVSIINSLIYVLCKLKQKQYHNKRFSHLDLQQVESGPSLKYQPYEQQVETPWAQIKWLSNQKYLVIDQKLKLQHVSFDLLSFHQEKDGPDSIGQAYEYLLENLIIPNKSYCLLKMSVEESIQLKSQQEQQQTRFKEFIQIMFNHSKFEYQFTQIQLAYSQFDFRGFIENCIGIQDNKQQNYIIIHFQEVDMQNEDEKFVLNNVCKSISHELSTNLNCITAASSEGMKSECIPQILKMEYFQPINTCAEQLSLITGNIRDYGAMEADQFKLKLTHFNLIEELESIMTYFNETAIAKSISMTLNEKSTSRTNEIDNIGDFNILTDRDRLRQVIYQLLSNSIRFTATGSIRIQIRVDSLNSFSISIKDSGVGMNVEEQNRLKQILNVERLVKVSEQSIGSSLGLFISNKIIKKLNTSDRNPLQFVSQINKGSKFSFKIQDLTRLVREQHNGSKRSVIKTSRGNINTILVIQDQKVQHYYEQPSVPVLLSPSKINVFGTTSVINDNRNSQQPYLGDQYSVFSPSRGNNLRDEESDVRIEYMMQNLQDIPYKFKARFDVFTNCCSKILIIDDEFSNIFALKILLKKFHTQCDHAFNGLEALQKVIHKSHSRCRICQSNSYPVIFLDINMPVMDGFTTVLRLKQMMKDKQIPDAYCVANTAFTDIETRIRAFECGMDEMINKPINIVELQTIIQNRYSWSPQICKQNIRISQ